MGWFYNLVAKIADATDSSEKLLKSDPHFSENMKLLEFVDRTKRETERQSKKIVKGTKYSWSEYMEIHYGKSPDETMFDFLVRKHRNNEKLPDLILENSED